MKMTLRLLGALSFFFLNSAFAFMCQEDHSNKIMYHVSGEQWVTTNTANVNVDINATLDKSGLDQARNNMYLNLKKIAAGEWHITRFDRTQDNSGLERLSVSAEARLPQSELGNVRENAKKVSRPGATYTINQIDFTPSLAEVENQREKLRQQLYQQTKAELARLNNVYPDQHFTLHVLNFIPGLQASPIYPKAERLALTANAETPTSAPPAIEVSNKINMTAIAIFAATKNDKCAATKS